MASKFNNMPMFSGSRLREYNRLLSIDHAIGRFMEKSSLYSTNQSVFANRRSFKNNPLGINLKAVASISLKLAKVLEEKGCFLSGWHIYDAKNGYFVISWSACDTNLYEVGNNILCYDSRTGRMSEGDETFFGNAVEPFATIRMNLPKILDSLKHIGVPIDLYEMRITDGAHLKEYGISESEQVIVYLMSGEISRINSLPFMVRGVSLSSDRISFKDLPLLEGGYTVLVV